MSPSPRQKRGCCRGETREASRRERREARPLKGRLQGGCERVHGGPSSGRVWPASSRASEPASRERYVAAGASATWSPAGRGSVPGREEQGLLDGAGGAALARRVAAVVGRGGGGGAAPGLRLLRLRLLLSGASEEVEGDAPEAATGRTASMERLAAALGRLAWSSGPPLPLDLIVAKCRLPALVRPGPGGSLARGAVGKAKGAAAWLLLSVGERCRGWREIFRASAGYLRLSARREGERRCRLKKNGREASG